MEEGGGGRKMPRETAERRRRTKKTGKDGEIRIYSEADRLEFEEAEEVGKSERRLMKDGGGPRKTKKAGERRRRLEKDGGGWKARIKS